MDIKPTAAHNNLAIISLDNRTIYLPLHQTYPSREKAKVLGGQISAARLLFSATRNTNQSFSAIKFKTVMNSENNNMENKWCQRSDIKLM